MQTQRFLFDPLGELHPDRILHTLEPAIPRLRGVVRDTFQDMQRRRQSDEMFARMDEGQSAWWMWTQIHHEAKEEFGGEPMLTFKRIRQQDFVEACESVVVVYKKLRRKVTRDGQTELVTSNYRTRQNLDMWGQRAIEGIPDLPRVILGYELRHELTEMQCFLGLPRGSNEKLQWHREIETPVGFEDGFGEIEKHFETQPIEDLGFEIEEIDDDSLGRFG